VKVSSRSWLAGAIAVGVIILAATTSSSAQTQTYLDPVTGRDCVLETGATSNSGYVTYRYHNSCGRRFSITVYVDDRSIASTTIAEYGDDTITVAESRMQGGNVTWGFQ
jgi:hypothetical protein